MTSGRALAVLVLVIAMIVPAVLPSRAAAGPPGCPVNMVKVGPACVDQYEATVWSKPPAGNNPKGVQYGAGVDDYPCSDNGNDCSESAARPIFAASLPGFAPSTNITWFQAQQACANVGKRLLRNAEWQMAAAGTPDGAPCVVSAAAPGPTGTPGCVSNWGTFDMVGNVWEWVEDWFQPNSNVNAVVVSTPLYGGDGIFGIDEAPNQPAPNPNGFPAALIRGGRFGGPAGGTGAGVFALSAESSPSDFFVGIGFRCGH